MNSDIRDTHYMALMSLFKYCLSVVCCGHLDLWQSVNTAIRAMHCMALLLLFLYCHTVVSCGHLDR